MDTSGRFLQDLMFVYFALHKPAYCLYRKVRGKTASPVLALDKVRSYRQETTRLWLETLSAVVVMHGVVPLFYAPMKLTWKESETWFLVILAVAASIWLFSEIVPSPWRTICRSAVINDFKRLRQILPETHLERQWWLWVCVTAGVCEELLYRGFLIYYLTQPPRGLSLLCSVFLSSAAFGAIHAWPSFRSALFAGIGGMTQGALFLLSGDLLLPIIVHACIDARILWIGPKRDEGSESNFRVVLWSHIGTVFKSEAKQRLFQSFY